MLDLSVAFNRYKFLGHEFLTWLWYTIEADAGTINQVVPELSALAIGNRMVIENRSTDNMESITIRGDDAGLEEGLLALKKGALVAEMGLEMKTGENEWRFTLKGESLDLSNLKTPETEPLAAGGAEAEQDGAVLEKVYLYEKAIGMVHALYSHFIRLRVSKEWEMNIVPLLKNWVAQSRKGQ